MRLSDQQFLTLLEQEQPKLLRIARALTGQEADARNPGPFDVMDWRVVDDRGEIHPARPKLSGSTSVGVHATQTSPMAYRAEITWTLPAGRNPATLVNLGFWQAVDDLGEVTIQIPAP